MAGAGAAIPVIGADDNHTFRVAAFNLGGGSPLPDDIVAKISHFQKVIGAGVLSALESKVWLLQEIKWKVPGALNKHFRFDTLGLALDAHCTKKVGTNSHAAAVVWDTNEFVHISDYKLYDACEQRVGVHTTDVSDICAAAAGLDYVRDTFISNLKRLCVVQLRHKTTLRDFLFASIHAPKRMKRPTKIQLIKRFFLLARMLARNTDMPMVLGGDFNLDLQTIDPGVLVTPPHHHSVRRTNHFDWIIGLEDGALHYDDVHASHIFPLPYCSDAWIAAFNAAAHNLPIAEQVQIAFEATGEEGALEFPADHELTNPWTNGGHRWLAKACYQHGLHPEASDALRFCLIFDHDPMVVRINL